jgi:hypothetical protein
MKRLLLLALVVILSFSLFSCVNRENATPLNKGGQPPDKLQQSNNSNEQTKTTDKDGSIVYNNTEYGFNFSLPESWKDYKIVADKWEGLAIGGAQGESVVTTGPLISIRHPEWTTENPRQDIPIMVFTISQWNDLQKDKFHIGAAPIGPSELGHNKDYVFALPARYNYAFPTGYEEVEQILQNGALQAIEK